MEPHPSYPHYHLPYRGLPPELRMQIWRAYFEKPIELLSRVSDDAVELDSLVYEDNWPSGFRGAVARQRFRFHMPDLRRELLQVNKEVHLEIIETWKTSVYILVNSSIMDTFEEHGLRSAIRRLPRRAQFKALIIRGSLREFNSGWTIDPNDLVRCLKVMDLILFNERAPRTITNYGTSSMDWTGTHDELHLHGAQKIVSFLLDGNVESCALEIVPEEALPLGDGTQSRSVEKWKAFNHFDCLTDSKLAKLNFTVTPLDIPGEMPPPNLPTQPKALTIAKKRS